MDKAFDLLTLVAESERSSGDRRSLQRSFRKGELVRIRRGAYVPTQAWNNLAAWERYRVELAAISHTFPQPPIFCDVAAATVWGLTTLLPADITIRHGLKVTDQVQTLLDLAVLGTFPEAVMAFDHAFRGKPGFSHSVSKEQLLIAVQDLAQSSKQTRALRVVEFADPLSESAGESPSRAQFHVLGLPAPTLQHEVFDANGFVARTDFYWKEFGLVGEFDGKIKYTRNAVSQNQRVEETVYQEKLREDRIRATGLNVVRWDWATAMNPQALRTKLHAVGLISLRVPAKSAS